ncbi:Hypothetical_protein [Hexamita inflata]|uniref:Hypothetical_protein n=1 Tax=Hexamita inflata TaxID=28002 RepID=A0AA86QKV4_9EUKA|nr:Hypothetical protein HINF_LOCUS24652 [Hexamita inflata]CAI9961396.1 Hypothetical protein HINF_LOCUS49041 [Hexamita inflata]
MNFQSEKDIDNFLNDLIPNSNNIHNEAIQLLEQQSQRDQFACVGVKINQTNNQTNDKFKQTMARLQLNPNNQNKNNQKRQSDFKSNPVHKEKQFEVKPQVKKQSELTNMMLQMRK